MRLIAATNRDLEVDVLAGRFRRDLYYRLAIVPIEVPPLRARPDDILPLARRFLTSISKRLNVPPPALRPEDEAALLAYAFPGNIRELHNIVERAVVMHSTGWRMALPSGGAHHNGAGAHASFPLPVPSVSAEAPEEAIVPAPRWKELERKNVMNALRKAGGRIGGPGGAAALLHMKPTTLAYRMKALGIPRAR